MWWAGIFANRARGYAKVSSIKLPIDKRIMSWKIERTLARSTYEQDEAKAAPRLFEHAGTVLELGAGLGFLSAHLRRRTKVGRIVAYEANPDLIDYIGRVHKTNGIGDIEVRHGVVLPTPPPRSTIPFYVRAHMWTSSLDATGSERSGPVVRTVDVPTFAWADVIADVQPDALMMDIEGGELDLIESCDPGPIKRMLVELHPAVYGVAGMSRIYQGLERRGFIYRNRLSYGSVLALER
jgi:FkbM family methyltransferase